MIDRPIPSARLREQTSHVAFHISHYFSLPFTHPSVTSQTALTAIMSEDSVAARRLSSADASLPQSGSSERPAARQVASAEPFVLFPCFPKKADWPNQDLGGVSRYLDAHRLPVSTLPFEFEDHVKSYCQGISGKRVSKETCVELSLIASSLTGKVEDMHTSLAVIGTSGFKRFHQRVIVSEGPFLLNPPVEVMVEARAEEAAKNPLVVAEAVNFCYEPCEETCQAFAISDGMDGACDTVSWYDRRLNTRECPFPTQDMFIATLKTPGLADSLKDAQARVDAESQRTNSKRVNLPSIYWKAYTHHAQAINAIWLSKPHPPNVADIPLREALQSLMAYRAVRQHDSDMVKPPGIGTVLKWCWQSPYDIVDCEGSEEDLAQKNRPSERTSKEDWLESWHDVVEWCNKRQDPSASMWGTWSPP